MSLTSVLKEKEMREKFKEHFPAPKIRLDSPIRAPPLTKRYSLIGTAFDYLLRFHVKRKFNRAVSRSWIAEHAVDKIKFVSGMYAYVDGLMKPMDLEKPAGDQFENAKMIRWPDARPDMEDISDFPAGKTFIQGKEWADFIRPAEEAKDAAKALYTRFVRTGSLPDDLVKSTLVLAKLDAIFRSGRLFNTDFNAEYEGVEDDVSDLKNLLAVAIDSGLFSPDYAAFLNPTFERGSALVGGADADMILDGMLIDVKTTKHMAFTQDMYNQILGYYALSTFVKMLNVDMVGIYFSRHGVLHTVPVNGINTDKIIGWFEEYRDKSR